MIIDIMRLVETHFTNKYNFQIRGYTSYRTDHPVGKAYGRTGILIRERIKHHFHQRFATSYLKATSIKVQSGNGNLTIAAVNCPPCFAISEAQLMDFYNFLGDRFIAAGDYNTIHTHWGSRLVTPKGRQLYNVIIKSNNKLDYVSPGNTTYWPTDPRKVSDLIEFAVAAGSAATKIEPKLLPYISETSFSRTLPLVHLSYHKSNQNLFPYHHCFSQR